MAQSSGVDFFGVADLSVARDAILEQGGSALASLPRAISIGITLLHSIVDQLPQRFQPAVAMNCKHHAYSLVNQRLGSITSRLSSVVQSKGYRALPVPASQTVDSERLLGAFSHKMAAHLAGLGWIGKSCLLVTPEAGPRVRWATILMVFAMRNGAEFAWAKDPDVVKSACPDGKNPVVFEIRRLRE